jgi:hypothetical protein
MLQTEHSTETRIPFGFVDPVPPKAPTPSALDASLLAALTGGKSKQEEKSALPPEIASILSRSKPQPPTNPSPK